MLFDKHGWQKRCKYQLCDFNNSPQKGIRICKLSFVNILKSYVTFCGIVDNPPFSLAL